MACSVHVRAGVLNGLFLLGRGRDGDEEVWPPG